MNDLLQNLVASLREEVKQYGELLAILEAQQEQVVRRQTDDVLAGLATVNAQGHAIRVARRERLQRQRDLAQSLRLPPESPIAALVPSLPEACRLLVTALVNEKKHLLRRVRQRARKNHLLLGRSLELMEKFINSFCAVGTATASKSGTETPPSSPGGTPCEEIC